MKKLFLFLFAFSGMIFALTDTDADGVSDDKDVCPRVYARSETGCPKLSATSSSFSSNSCLTEQLSNGKIIASVTPICDRTICPTVSRVVGIQSCDPIFPIIFDKNGLPLIRGSIFIVDYIK